MSTPILDEYRKILPPVEMDIPPEERDMAAMVDRQLAAAEPKRIAFLRQCQVGIAQYSTETQWTDYSDRTGKCEPVPSEPWQKRVTVNHTAPIVDTIAANLTSTLPGWHVTPATTEDTDVESAKACDKLLEHVYRENQLASKLYECMQWAGQTGIAWLAIAWDPSRGDEVEDEPFEAPGMDSTYTHEAIEGEPAEPMELAGAEGEHKPKPYGWELEDEPGESTPDSAKPMKRRTGFPTLTVVPPPQLVVDPGCVSKDLDDCQWIAHRSYPHIDEVHARWPERAPFVQPDTRLTEDSYASSVMSSLQGGMKGSTDGQANQPDRVELVNYYERRSPRHPNGRYIIKAGRIILEHGKLACGGELPFVCWRLASVAGRLWGQGTVSRVVSLQRQVNYQRSKLTEMAGLHANNKWRAPDGSIKANAITNKPAEVLMYDPLKGPPEPIPPPPISPEFRNIARECADDMYTIAGVSEMSRGVIPSGISGRAAGIAQDEDAKRRLPVVRELGEALERAGRMVLMLWRDNMDQDVTIRTLGDNNQLQAMAFKAGSIRSTDVRIDMSSMAARNPTIQREQTMQMAERGLLGDITNPDVLARIQKALAMPGLDDPTQGADPEDGYAQEQAFELLNGSAPPVHPWENHAAHVRVLRKLLQTSDVRAAPPEVLQGIMRALATREAYIAAAASGTPWWQKYAAPEALELLQPPAPPPQAAPPPRPALPPYDAFGSPPEAFLPPAPPIPTGESAMGMPLEGPGVQGLAGSADLAQPSLGGSMM